MVEESKSAWETETGLPNDVDGYIVNPHFGEKDEYAAAVKATGAAAAIMFLFDLVDEKGEPIGSQGYSIGTGWEVAEDGKSISHPKRKNVVGTTMYGQLQIRVVKELKVNMDKYGLPTKADSWAGLGFHWMLEEHPTVGGDKRQGIMPTEFLGEKDVSKVTVTPVAAPTGELETALADLAKGAENIKAFQVAAVKIPGVAADDALMAGVLDDGADGFFARHKG